MRTAKDAFLLKEWLSADADGRQPADASLAEGVSCDELYLFVSRRIKSPLSNG
jgi:hypothetical protein